MNLIKTKRIYVIMGIVAVTLIAIGTIMSLNNKSTDNGNQNYDSLWKDKYYEYYLYTQVENGISIYGLTDLGKQQTELIIPKDCIEIVDWSIEIFGGSESFANKVVQKIVFLNENTKLGEGVDFENCINLETLVLPDTLTEIPLFFCDGCKNLKEITMGDSVEKIGNYAFSNTAIKTIRLPRSLKEIGNGVYEYCDNLKEIIFSNSIEKIGNHAFSNDSALEKVTLPDSLKIIGDGAFFECKGLKEIKLSQSLESIGKFAFSDTIITNIEIPGTVKTIGDYAFQYCIYLKSVMITEGTERIGKCVFMGCLSLEKIYLPRTIKDVGDFIVGKVSISEWNKGYASLTIYVKQNSYIDTNFKNIKIADGIVINKSYY